jgi:hypothetical protein
MSIDIQMHPIERWPGEYTKNRKKSMFKASYGKTLDLLEYELGLLKATNVILQVALESKDIRLDGKPRSGAKAAHPGIILTFDSKYGPLQYPCDRFDDWEDNLRAIALSLEHLRAVDRYGVTKRGEQYTGWTALPNKNGKMSHYEAMAMLSTYSGMELTEASTHETRIAAYRKAAAAAHPDRGQGDAAFKEVQAAKDVLGL